MMAPLIIQSPNIDTYTNTYIQIPIKITHQIILTLPTKYQNAALCRLWGGTTQLNLVA